MKKIIRHNPSHNTAFTRYNTDINIYIEKQLNPFLEVIEKIMNGRKYVVMDHFMETYNGYNIILGTNVRLLVNIGPVVTSRIDYRGEENGLWAVRLSVCYKSYMDQFFDDSWYRGSEENIEAVVDAFLKRNAFVLETAPEEDILSDKEVLELLTIIPVVKEHMGYHREKFPEYWGGVSWED